MATKAKRHPELSYFRALAGMLGCKRQQETQEVPKGLKGTRYHPTLALIGEMDWVKEAKIELEDLRKKRNG
jgi:hypothetical protein